MYMRFVHLQVREGAEAQFDAFYRERVIPAMRSTPGCRFAGLLTPWRGGDAHQSLTIWDTPEEAAGYEESPLFRQLSREAEPLLSAKAEWRVRLGKDPLATIDPSDRVIPSTGYVVEGGVGTDMPEGRRPVFVRILSVRIDPERLREFIDLYAQHVVPTLKQRPGCRGVLLAEGAEHPDGFLSITLWDREEDAVRYETSGEPERLTARLKATFSPLYDWRLTLGDLDPRAAAPQVASYHLVPSQPFKAS
jgi:heme-degrading monooxygenase HmoA